MDEKMIKNLVLSLGFSAVLLLGFPANSMQRLDIAVEDLLEIAPNWDKRLCSNKSRKWPKIYFTKSNAILYKVKWFDGKTYYVKAPGQSICTIYKGKYEDG